MLLFNQFKMNNALEVHKQALQSCSLFVQEDQEDIIKLTIILFFVCFVFAGLCCYTKCQPAPEAARPEYSVDQAYVRQLEELLAVLQPQLRASTSSLASVCTQAHTIEYLGPWYIYT